MADKEGTWKKYGQYEIKKSRRPSYSYRAYLPAESLLSKAVDILPNLPNPKPTILLLVTITISFYS